MQSELKRAIRFFTQISCLTFMCVVISKTTGGALQGALLVLVGVFVGAIGAAVMFEVASPPPPPVVRRRAPIFCEDCSVAIHTEDSYSFSSSDGPKDPANKRTDNSVNGVSFFSNVPSANQAAAGGAQNRSVSLNSSVEHQEKILEALEQAKVAEEKANEIA